MSTALAALGTRARALVRAEQWWSFKLIPMLAVAYATALRRGQPLGPHWPRLLALIVALGLGAAGVSLINDLFDRADDARAGKANRLAGMDHAGVTHWLMLLLSGEFLLGQLALYWAGAGPGLIALMLLNWLIFLAYSMPPLRLKARGLWGVLADAAGAHMCPALLAALMVGGDGAPDGLWLLAVSVWAMALGLRGIVWHQLLDQAADRASGVATFVTRIGPERARRWVVWLVFPLELGGLLAMLGLLARPEPWLALSLYGALLLAMVRRFAVRAVIVQSCPRFTLVLQDYYLVLLPTALLVALLRTHGGDLTVAAMHLVAFAGTYAGFFRLLGRLWRH